ncbi:MAG: bifunctional metallophosphatase/5'-nucleotidase, partial [Firmicutes bacterium]|nr:bifunctional metallophosphatase/5'-nucleotidase [Bacillota bacterium]
MKKKILTLAAALLLIFALAIPVYADGELSGKLYILHTNDVHGAIEGYSKLKAYKDELEAKGADVVIVDAGDFSQGSQTVNIEKGLDAVKLMNAVGYDVATLGNHEFDYGIPQLISNMDQRTFKVVCSNIKREGEYLFDGPFAMIEKGGVKVTFIGVATPETQTKANPALVRDLTFYTNLTTPSMYDQVQEYITFSLSKGSDVIIALAHLGVYDESEPNRSVDLYSNVLGLDMIIDGHSHTEMTSGKNGEPVQSTGSNLKKIGVVVIDENSKRIESNSLVDLADLTETDPVIDAMIDEINAKAQAAMGEVIGTSEVELNGDKAPGNRTEETNNGDFITDAMLWALTEQYPGSITGVSDDNIIALTNGGGIRHNIAPGEFTKGNIFDVLPYGNTLSVIYVSGYELLEALEASTYVTPAAIGGFPQIAGMKITVDTTKKYDANDTTYPNSQYYGPKTINRITINEINGNPFDPDATYAVITNNFIAEGGDTYYAFAAEDNKFDTGITVDTVVMEYVSEKLGGVIRASQYAFPQGRITVVLASDEEPVSPPTFDMNAAYIYLMLASSFTITVIRPKKKRR